MTIRSPSSFALFFTLALTQACMQPSKGGGGGGGGATGPDKDKDKPSTTIETQIEGQDPSNRPKPGETQNGSTTGTQTATTVTPPAQEEECYKADPEICKAELKIFELVNKMRKEKGMAEFTFAKKLGWVAREWSVTQAKRGWIGHDGFPNQRERLFNQEFKTNPDVFAENVAMTGGGGSAEAIGEELYDMWFHSAGHRANMQGRYKAIGIGVAKDGDGWYGTQIFGDE